ncbi:hypothetical protein ACVWZZ_002193 [Bradyrhizobium sp. LM6.10]
MPPRASHLPSHVERNALQKLQTGREMRLKDLALTGHRTILIMIAKRWIERGSESGTHRITPSGDAALRMKLP